MKQKIINHKVRKVGDYVRLMNGLFGLTDSELQVLAEFITIHLTISKYKIQVNAFSTDMKKKVALRLGKSNFNSLNTYIKALADKGAIRKIAGGYEIDDKLIPIGESQVVFIIRGI